MPTARNLIASTPALLTAEGAERGAFVSRLQTILSHWPSADRLARAMGVSPSAFRKWLKGEAEPSRERLVALARAAGVGVAWLAEGTGPNPNFESANTHRQRHGVREATTDTDWSDFVLVPSLTNGPHPMALRQDWIRTQLGLEPDHVLFEIASGEAMAPTIRDGDMLFIDTTERPVAGHGIYMLEIGGHREVRRVQRKHDGSLVLISDNAAYQPDVVSKSEADSVVVVGRVVWAAGPI